MAITCDLINKVVKEIGFPNLKDKQEEAVLSFLKGNDVFVSLPTGFGKSYIYAILPFVFNKIKDCDFSIVICISPLTSIMMDQCENFRSLGIAAEFIGEAQKDKRIIERVLNGDIQLVYISPESILTNLRYRQMLRSPQYMERLVAVAVDEAHLVKEWGDNFRVAFSQLGDLRSIIPEKVNIIALTATATKQTLEVVQRRLSLRSPVIIGLPPNKDNIMYKIEPLPKMEKFCEQLASSVREARTNFPKTIIFCQNYPDCANMYHLLRCKLGEYFTDPPGYPSKFHCFRIIDMYNRACTQDMKEKIMSSMKTIGSKLRIVIATTAFSMGVDCSDIIQIIHFGTPSTIHQYVQETGRAGRGSQQAYAILLHGKEQHTEPAMNEYVSNKRCRRQALFKDFLFVHGNSTVPNCKCCDVCAEKNCTCDYCI